MKINNKALKIVTYTLIAMLFVACASKEKTPRERDEFFVADISPIEIGTYHLYASFGLSKPKICDFNISFYPRTNVVYIKGRVGMDIIMVGFNYKERQSIGQAKDKYIEAYKNHTLKNEKPSKKNSFSTGTLPFGWGALSPSYHATVNYLTNAEYILENKPYFRIRFESTRGLGDDSKVSSPRTSIYISPAQWEQITKDCSQENLESLADEVLNQANNFDTGSDFDEEIESSEETQLEVF